MGKSMPDRDPLLVEREKSHGSFYLNAYISQEIKAAYLRSGIYTNLKPEHREALDMIALKIARILSNPNVKDHWIDVAGYAHLGAEACPTED